MTKIDRPLLRETGEFIKGKPLIIELHPTYLQLRTKLSRFKVTVDYRSILDLGYKILHRAEMEKKKEARASSRRRQKRAS